MLTTRPRAFRPRLLVSLIAFGSLAPVCAHPQPPDTAAVLKAVDDSVAHREAMLAGYTAIEHYAVYRGGDDAHPVAEMTVKTTYRKESGKSYEILNESGSQLLRKAVLERTLADERDLTRPAERVRALIDTSNYKMTVASSAALENHPCTVLRITPRKSASYLFAGQIWVDSRDGSIMQLKGTTAKPVSILAGPTQVDRRYTLIDGYPMATRATADTSVALVGQIRMVIDYSDYHLQPAGEASRSSGMAPQK